MARIVFWQYILTDHQIETLREVARIHCDGASIVAFSIKSRVRESQGWSTVSDDGVTLLTGGLPQRMVAAVRILIRGRKDTHVFSSMWGRKDQFCLLLIACAMRVRVGVISEPFSTVRYGCLADEPSCISRVKVTLRRWLYPLVVRSLRSRVGFLLGISRIACEQFREAGLSGNAIYPFAYFVRRVRKCPTRPPVVGPGMKVAFVGNLIGTKGPDILDGAVRILRERGYPIELDFFGPRGDGTQGLVLGAGIHRGAIEYGAVPSVLSEYDVLVVPSRHDGWAVVVNEAIMAGTPVIVSQFAGASAMVQDNGLGLVFDGSVEGLVSALQCASADPAHMMRMRDACRRFAKEIDPRVGAEYVIKVIDAAYNGAPRPKCPWYSWSAQ